MTELQPVEIFTSLVGREGCLLEHIGGNQLIHCHHGRIETAAEIACGDLMYRAGQLPTSLEAALKLPLKIAETDDPGLFAALKNIFLEAAGLSEGDAVVLASVVLASWMGDFVCGVSVNLIGSQAVTAPVKALLSALARNPLSLATFNLTEMARLPAGLLPTVLLSAPSARALQELALTTGDQLQVVRRGNLELLPRCLGIVCSDEPAPLGALRINLVGQSEAAFRASYLADLEAQLRPALLRYRLTHYATLANSTCDSPFFCPETRAWAQLLGAVVTPFPGATAEVVEALRPQDQAQQASLADSVQGAVLEAVFLSIHADTTPPYVQDVARLANVLLAGRGESELTTRGVGARLRKLGFACERKGAGYRLVLSKDVRQRVHRLAQDMGVPLPVENSAGCPCCAELSRQCAGSGGESHSPVADDVHNVHDLHHVHPASEVQAANLSANEECR
jgi:hypothetical protein